MEDAENKLKRLLEAGEWSEEEKLWLLQYLESSDNSALNQIMFRLFNRNLQDEREEHPASSRMLTNIHRRIGQAPARRILPAWFGKAAAAAIIAVAMVGSILWWHAADTTRLQMAKTSSAASPARQDISPGTNKAVLTLSDGSTILLDDARNGKLAQQGDTRLLKFNGKISYNPGQADAGKVAYNSIATPRGGQYQVELPDGSQVWLNAASSIRFPTVFSGTERRVELTGEAYFEVARNAAMPFIVQVNQSEVRVLGTHFNVMAYNEEAYLKTTLLEGSVKFVNGENISMLKPGQQAQLAKSGRVNIEKDVHVEEEVAWKNGSFHFERAGIEHVMRQLARWYDVEVEYKSAPAGDLFHADIPRNTNLSLALRALELTGKVHFETTGKKVIVIPQ